MNRLLYFAVIIIFTSCGTNEEKLNNEVKGLAEYLRNDSISQTEVVDKLKLIASDLSEATNRQLNEDNWVTNIEYKWNSDSSIVFIKSIKNIEQSHKRETILNLKDSALIILRYHVWFDKSRTDKEGKNNPGYIFQEEISYLTQGKIIKLLRKMDFDNSDLSDTVKFKQAPFYDLSADSTQNWYDSELEYTTTILNRN